MWDSFYLSRFYTKQFNIVKYEKKEKKSWKINLTSITEAAAKKAFTVKNCKFPESFDSNVVSKASEELIFQLTKPPVNKYSERTFWQPTARNTTGESINEMNKCMWKFHRQKKQANRKKKKRNCTKYIRLISGRKYAMNYESQSLHVCHRFTHRHIASHQLHVNDMEI